MQADPLGLVDGASVYGYALQNPGRYVDPRGEFVPLLFMFAGIILGEVVEYLYDRCECNSNGASERYGTVGALAEIFGPTHPKPVRPFGGSRAHSMFSGIISQTNMGQANRNRVRRLGRNIAKKIPYLGAAFILYDGGRLLQCFIDEE